MSRYLALHFLLVLLAVGARPSLADRPPFSDEECLAVSLSDSLLPPDSLIARIGHDLALIRQHTPATTSVHYSCERLEPGKVRIDIYYAAKQLFLAGEHQGMNELHARIGTPDVWWAMEYTANLYFSRPYNPLRLEELYSQIWGVWDSNARPRCIGDGPDIRIRTDGTYEFRYAWGGGCMAGSCAYSHTWIFRVDGEGVTLLEDYGDLVPADRISWGTLKALFR